ncbi:MAG: sulfide:quinone oxidoreductase [Candidatus Promineifilaceae bacterium]|jgi:sulfide:quinone oxidoreductase
MKKLLILGGGTAGTIVANKLYRALPQNDWEITVVDQDVIHYYQPGFLFIPFGTYDPNDVKKDRRNFLPDGVNFVMSEIDKIDPEAEKVILEDGQALAYDHLIIATGTTPRPEETPGLEGVEWGKSIHEFYTFEGSCALAQTLKDWPGGRLVVNVMETPIKCPVAPMEFVFLADAFFTEKGMRHQVDIVYATPLSGAFTKPVASERLQGLLDERKVRLVSDFYVEEVDTENRELRSYDEEVLPYDLLVTVPVNMGADFIERSNLGDELNHVPVDKHNFQSKKYDNIFALGDAAALPTSKAGSVAHFAVDVFTENFLALIKGQEMKEKFDGHANCFIETGFGKGILLDFNYDVEPLPGKFPLPGVGPFKLLGESRFNHWGKMAFRWIYWNSLLTGRLPLPADMSMAGKEIKYLNLEESISANTDEQALEGEIA